MDNRHEVLSEFLFGAELCIVENDEFSTRSGDDPLDELCAEPREAVPVGTYNCRDSFFLDGDQKPLEPFPFEVESRGDVREDFEPRVLLLERLRLADEVVFLLAGTDSGVDRTFCLTRCLFKGGGECSVSKVILASMGLKNPVTER